MARFGFELELRVAVRKYELDEANPAYRRYSDERLSVDDTRVLGALQFGQVAQVLARFEELADALSAEFSDDGPMEADIDGCEPEPDHRRAALDLLAQAIEEARQA